jgi:hypothetical protein
MLRRFSTGISMSPIGALVVSADTGARFRSPALVVLEAGCRNVHELDRWVA